MLGANRDTSRELGLWDSCFSLPDLMMASTCCFMVTAGECNSHLAQVHTLSLSFLFSSAISLFLIFFSFFFYLLVESVSHIFILVTNLLSLPSLFFIFFHFYLPPCSTPFFHFPFFSSWLIALMFFLWSTATSSSSELVWPHVFQEGMSRCGGEGPQGAQTAKYQNNMSHSCLMTSTIQPCRAPTVRLHPKGGCNMKAIHLFHAAKYSYFVITRFTDRTRALSGIFSSSIKDARMIILYFLYSCR